MKLLVVGGGGYVGSILGTTLDREHICYHFDRRPLPGKGRLVVADVTDPVAVHRAVQGMDGILYMPLGIRPGSVNDVADPATNLEVNTLGFYLFAWAGLLSGIRRFIYVSTMSVYSHEQTHDTPITEEQPPAEFGPYGLSKRLGEQVGQAVVQKAEDATVIVIRLCGPKSEQDWSRRRLGARLRRRPTNKILWKSPLGPNDMRRLFQALVACDRPGFHVINASGDVSGKMVSHENARRLLDWQPQGD